MADDGKARTKSTWDGTVVLRTFVVSIAQSFTNSVAAAVHFFSLRPPRCIS